MKAKPLRPLLSHWPDFSVVVVLWVVTILSWTAATGIWKASDWGRPGAYLDAEKGDVIFHLAVIRAARDGHFVPLRSKTVPELGAPFDGNWNDWPIVEEIPVFLMGLAAGGIGIFASLNFALLIGHLLAATTFYLVARYLAVAREWSFLGGLAFGLAPYLFSQSPHHPFVELCWHVPLFLLVWNWVVADSGVKLWSGRFWFGVAVGGLAGLQMVYYTGIFCQLVLIGAGIAFWRNRAVGPLVSALSFIVAAALAFGLMNVDTWAYRIEHGANAAALVREYKWLEIYGLKMVDLFVPPIVHRGDVFQSFAQSHAVQKALQDEGSYLGIIGILALLFLAGTAVLAVLRRHPEAIPTEAWQVLWILLYFGTGGLNAISGLGGITMFRAGCRYSIIILAIVLLFAVQRLSKMMARSQGISPLAAICLSLIVFWDQVPRTPLPTELKAISSQVEADRAFVEALEQALPLGAMVFQIPVMDFPEAPIPGVPSYDHLRPYLYAKDLRFSFGSMKGRQREQWQHDLVKKDLPDAVADMRVRGFDALIINRKGFPDGGKAIEEKLRSMGYAEVISGPADDMVAVLLTSPN